MLWILRLLRVGSASEPIPQKIIDSLYSRQIRNTIGRMKLKSKIDQLWNKCWSCGISNPLTAIEQITDLLFMKRLDELDQKRQAGAEFTGEKYALKFSPLCGACHQ